MLKNFAQFPKDFDRYKDLFIVKSFMKRRNCFMTFGQNLINLRKQNKMTQEDVAEKLDITRQTVSNWELNQTNPNLEQLKDLSKLYKISLDKLVDNNINEIKAKEASNSEKFKKLFNRCINFISKDKKLLLMIFTLLCIIAMGVCAIVDYRINNAITWAYIPILSVIFGYLITIPMFAKKHKLVLFLSTVTITILPFLYLMEKAVTLKDWFYPVALPICIATIIGVWISYLLCHFLKISGWYKSAFLIFMWGAIIPPIINHISDGLPYMSLQNFTNVFSGLVISLACVIYGYIKTRKNK